jgi:cobalt-precorrin-5B (C1)-methyltransferase
MLLRGDDPAEVAIRLPRGLPLTLALTAQSRGEGWARCGVVKDAGDDPDVTDGITVMAEVRPSRRPGIRIRGGPGVGTVRRPGLPVAVGQSAINPVPRRMILRELEPLLDRCPGLEVTISVPGGEELAGKTWNPRLGIEGGISIIGTSGIVEPKSTAAYKSSIAAALRVALGDEASRLPLFLAFGYVGERVLLERFRIPEHRIVRIGDHVGFSLRQALKRGADRLVLIGHLSKLAKVAAGLFNTHSQFGDARLETIAAAAAAEGASAPLVRELLALETAEAAVEVLEGHGLAGSFNRVATRARERCLLYADDLLHVGGERTGQELAVALLDLSGRVLAVQPEAALEAEKWFPSSA